MLTTLEREHNPRNGIKITRLPRSMSNVKNKTKQKLNNGCIQHCIYSEK